jgi:hypothetical protein
MPAQAPEIRIRETSHETSHVEAPVIAKPVEETGPIYEPDPEGRPVAILRSDAPNMRYANMDGATCERELGKRSIAFTKVAPFDDVLHPVRLGGSLHGVALHGGGGQNDIFDCRLVLAVDDFAARVSEHGVTEMLYSSAFRSRKQNGCTHKYAGLQHCGALALDIHFFKKKDGTTVSVEKDFHGKIGNSTCGGSKPNPVTPQATELWAMVCDAASRGIFNVMLTPNFNAEHFNHIHVEVTPEAEWMLIK